MRAWTFGVSVAVHLGVIAGVVVAPLVATAELPIPPRVTAYVRVTASMPPDPPPVRPASAPTAASGNAAPLDAPGAVVPEPALPETTAPAAPDAVDFSLGDARAAPVAGAGVVEGVPEPTPPPLAAPPPAPYRVGGRVLAPQKIRDVAPRYPPIAQASRVEGIVILETVISADGAVLDVRVLRSQPLLDAAAVDAVRQWRFTPGTLNGVAVPVVMTVTVAFRLQ